MITTYKRNPKLMLLGLKGSGKSQLKVKLIETMKTKKSDAVQNRENQSNIEIIETQDITDQNQEFDSIFKEIKENNPNILAYVQKVSDLSFGEPTHKLIEGICKLFDTKSIWNHFIIVFTSYGDINDENREDFTKKFSESIMDILRQYYENNTVNDNKPLPNTFNYYFFELNDKNKCNSEQVTINNLEKIMKLMQTIQPISNSKEKILLEIKTRKKCKETIGIYDIVHKDKYGGIKKNAAKTGLFASTFASTFSDTTLAMGTLAAIGSTAFGPLLIAGMAIGSFTGFSVGSRIEEIIKKTNFEYNVDENFKKEDFIIYDEETYFYHDGTVEVKKINIENCTRIIPK